ncbi:GNAT family N-acetyltransferase [Terribacillus sp. DMT04]|uniref:GNAT family N-acetyltransferase n=1 Tax=Terribacillus sp. DMT04 TaxID=2850441 RepID=UPI001C2BEFE0|nr:GNAT family N-acetyltransferase [Terribacillus sp. DMT04]QXE01210.1 GNAT family N-acetyltransferase [Terribacillus sp. DMT04]
MRFIQEHDASRLLAAVEALLLQHEAANNLLLGLLRRIADGEDMSASFGYGEQAGEIRTVFLVIKGERLIISHGLLWQETDAERLAAFVQTLTPDLPGVIGPIVQAKQFAHAWHQLSGKQSELHMNQFIYQLNYVENTGKAKGEIQVARSADFTLLRDWLIRFGKELGEKRTEEQADATIGRLISQQRMYIWKVDGQPVSMAGCSRESRNGIVINAVFTPQEHRQQGYAQALVGQLSAKLLQDGKRFCCLFTDADNDGPNKLYQRIGYKQVAESCAINFK